MNNKGRPAQEMQGRCEHEERPIKAQSVKEYWTEHRITLIAYEAQYIYAKKPDELMEFRDEDSDKKKKSTRKKVNLEFESGFLSISPEVSDQIKVDLLVKDYDALYQLFTTANDENFSEVKEFVKIMLELKHSDIVREFCELYNIIVRQLKAVEFAYVEKEESRFEWLQKIKEKMLKFIGENREKFPILSQYLRDDEKQTKKLILVEIYCFLAEKFNFNINEFYSEAFSVTLESKATKKVKRSPE